MPQIKCPTCGYITTGRYALPLKVYPINDLPKKMFVCRGCNQIFEKNGKIGKEGKCEVTGT